MKLFEGFNSFNIPFKITGDKREPFEDAYKRVKEYFKVSAHFDVGYH